MCPLTWALEGQGGGNCVHEIQVEVTYWLQGAAIRRSGELHGLEQSWEMLACRQQTGLNSPPWELFYMAETFGNTSLS